MHNFSSENKFYLNENETSFPYERLSTLKPRFDTEARGDSEIAYCSQSPLLVLTLIFFLADINN